MERIEDERVSLVIIAILSLNATILNHGVAVYAKKLRTAGLTGLLWFYSAVYCVLRCAHWLIHPCAFLLAWPTSFQPPPLKRFYTLSTRWHYSYMPELSPTSISFYSATYKVGYVTCKVSDDYDNVRITYIKKTNI